MYKKFIFICMDYALLSQKNMCKLIKINLPVQKNVGARKSTEKILTFVKGR